MGERLIAMKPRVPIVLIEPLPVSRIEVADSKTAAYRYRVGNQAPSASRNASLDQIGRQRHAWRYFVPVQVERKSFHVHTLSHVDAPLQRPVELSDTQPETGVRIDVRQNTQQDANHHVRARRRNHPLKWLYATNLGWRVLIRVGV
jgi:hypothetical protein